MPQWDGHVAFDSRSPLPAATVYLGDNMILTNSELAAIEARAASATAGPWESVPVLYSGMSADGLSCWSESEGRIINGPPQTLDRHNTLSCRWFKRKEDGGFIAAARTDVPRMAETIRELQRQLAAMTAEAARQEDRADFYSTTPDHEALEAAKKIRLLSEPSVSAVQIVVAEAIRLTLIAYSKYGHPQDWQN